LRDAVEFGAGKAGLLLGQGSFNLFVIEDKGNEDGFTTSVLIGREASESIAAVDQLFYREFQVMILCYWPRGQLFAPHLDFLKTLDVVHAGNFSHPSNNIFQMFQIGDVEHDIDIRLPI